MRIAKLAHLYLIATALLIGLADVYASALNSLLATSNSKHKTGIEVLEKGEESLLARAWLVEHAEHSIDAQYFIWSTDNIGTLASEALLRAADRGVKVRILVDDLLIEAEPQTLLALAAHNNVSIRIYNPKNSVGVSTAERLWNLITDFRGFNQRMHDKTVIYDGQIAITGGRNMADEYYDYDHTYNFRDRDLLVAGSAIEEMSKSFERFWQNPLSVPLEQQLADEHAAMDADDIKHYREWLHTYANDPENFAPEVKQALQDMGEGFSDLINGMTWTKARFISDEPGKNSGDKGLGGGGKTTTELADMVRNAQQSVTIQSPYLIMPPGALELFKTLIERGVTVKISTNSLASTDNLQAFSGYSNQRDELLASGIEVYEFKPKPQVERALIERYAELEREAPIFSLHAKTVVVDSSKLYVGTFNLDPRSANLNTELGLLIDDPALAQKVELAIKTDMDEGNSWNSNTADPDQYASWGKRIKLWFWQLMPLEPIL